MNRLTLFLIALSLFSLTRCTQRAEPPAAVSEIPVPVAEEGESLAHLESFSPRVTFRRSQDLSWEEALLPLSFFRFDAVRTHDKSSALIQFVRGSQINMIEKSLVIINDGAEAEVTAPDRLVFRSGKLQARTRKQLWLLTSTGMVKVEAETDTKPARADIEIAEGKELRVGLSEGKGFVMKSQKPGQFASPDVIPLQVGKISVLAAPTAERDFGWNRQKKLWPGSAVVETATRQVSNIPSPEPPKPKEIDFVISAPEDYARVKTSVVELKGRLTGPGGDLLVNGKSVKIAKDLSFTAKVPLSTGANSISFQLNRPGIAPLYRNRTIVRSD